MSGFTDLSISTNTKRILGTDYLEDSSGKREELHLQLTKVTKELDLIAENQRNLTTQKALKSTNQKVEKYQDLTLDIEKIEEEARSLKDLD